MLEALAVVVARRIDAIRLMHERYERELREQEIAKLATEAELRALRAQINPHFLFNALTTIGYLIQTAPPRALKTLMRLTALLRSVLRSEGEFTTLGRELEIVESYLEIERARFEERLRVRIDVPGALRSLRVPPLLLQPLVENAVKHGDRAAACGAARSRLARSSIGPPATPTSSGSPCTTRAQARATRRFERGRAARRRLSATSSGGSPVSTGRRPPVAFASSPGRARRSTFACRCRSGRSPRRPTLAGDGERAAASRHRRRRAAGAVVSRRAPAVVRRCRARRRGGVGQGRGGDDRAREAGPRVARSADAGARRASASSGC